jgi:stage II sporulation protein D
MERIRMQRRLMLFFLVLLAFMSGWVFIPGSASEAAAFNGIIKARVSTAGQTADIRVIPHGKYYIAESPGTKLQDTEYKVHLSGSNVQILLSGKAVYTGSKITLVRAAGNTVNNFIIFPASPTQKTRICYPGNMEFSASGGALYAVNHVYVEEYVMGVVPYEMSPSWPTEALKAQAVCARNYGVKAALNSSATARYHIGDTASTQVYRGVPGVSSDGTVNMTTYNTIKNVVNATDRQVMRYVGDVFSAYFSAWNGGETLNARGWTGNTSSVYGYTVVKPDVYDDRRCRDAYWDKSPYKVVVNTDLHSPTGNDVNMDIQKMLVNKYKAQYGVSASDVYVVSTGGIKGKAPSAEPAVSIVFQDFYCDVRFNTESSNKRVTFTDADLKSALGISSSYIAFRIENDAEEGTTTLYNVRYGHGVGMSQRGAQQMANEGKDYKFILNFYYKDVTLSKLSVSAPALPAMPGGGAQTTYTGTIVNCTTAVNVRSGPGTSYSKVGTAPKGAKYTVTKPNYTADWHQIVYNGKTAYIHKDYLSVKAVTTTPKPSASATPKPATPTPKPTATAAPPATYIGTVVNCTTAVNVRSGPGTNYSKLGTAKKGATYTVKKKNYTADWHQISYNGKTAYIHKDYLSIKATTSTPKPSTTPTPSTATSYTGTVVNCTTAVNVRSGPGTNYSKLGTAKKGATYTVKKRNYTADWHQISYNGKTAYIHKSYLSVKAVTSKGTATSTPKPSATPTPSTTTSYTGTVVNCTTAVNVRSGPGTNYSKLGTAKKGATYTVKKRNYTADWHQISYNGKTAYIHKSYLSVKAVTSKGAATPTPKPATYTGTIVNCTTAVNVRSGPGTNYSLLGTAKKGAKYTVTKKNYTADWHQISYNGKTAYIHKQYLSVK